MSPAPAGLSDRSRLAILLEHLATIDDPHDVRRITHPLAEILLLVVCGTLADCDDYDHVAGRGEAHLDFLRRHLPCANGAPGGRWLTILMNRVNPTLFSAVSTVWGRGTWPDRPDRIEQRTRGVVRGASCGERRAGGRLAVRRTPPSRRAAPAGRRVHHPCSGLR